MQMVGVSASVNLPLHHKVQKFSSGTGTPGWSRKNGRNRLWRWWCIVSLDVFQYGISSKPQCLISSHNYAKFWTAATIFVFQMILA